MPDSDDVCQCGHPRSEHKKIEEDYYECSRMDCECEDYRLAAESDDPATADEEDDEKEE